MQKKTYTVCVFCGSKSGNNIKYLKLANTLGKKLAERNFNVIYGGGNSGLMGALAEGVLAKNGSLTSVIPKFFKNKMDIIKSKKEIITKDLFDRKSIMIKKSDFFIALPGGFGTLDEMFEALTLIQTEKSGKFPVILIGRDFWNGLIDWIKNTLLEEEQNISPEDLDLIKIVDSAEEAVGHISDYYKNHHLKPNF